MSFIDEYDLDMYKNIVMANNCKDEELLCIFNTSSFLNTICFFIFVIMFLWALAILSRFYLSYNIMKYLKNRKAIYMKNMSRYIDDIKMLCRSHVNDIIRIKKKITPRHVEKINLNISINNNIQLFKNYLSSSSNDLNNLYKYSISFTFSSKNCIYIRLFFGVLLEEINDMIYNKTESYRNLNYYRDDENNKNMNHHNNLNNNNTVICIDNFKNFFREGFIKTLPSNKKNSSDATTFLLDNDKNDFFITNESYIENIIDFHTCYYKTSQSFYTSGTDLTYTMPYDENFCVTDILNRIEIEKKQKDENNSNNYSNNSSNNNSPNNDDNIYNNNNNNNNNNNDYNNNIYNHIYSDNLMFNDNISRAYRNNHLDSTNNNIFLSSEHTNRYKNNKVFLQNDSKILNHTSVDENIRIPLIIVLNDVPPTDEYYGHKENIKNNYNNINTTTTTNTTTTNNTTTTSHNNNNNNCNTLIVLVGFKKIKDKYKPFIIKDISVLSYSLSEQYDNLGKKKKKKGKSISNNNNYNNQIYQFVDILDIYGHEEHDKECLICMTSYKDTLLMPCRHSSFCYDCMKSLRQEKCPICRCLFTSFIKFPLKNVERVDT
ncbi:hypothetical protein PFUGPA_05767 [Plasmodium falciparum Palo Alto/Uganda]|uniref:RING-type domain-containing protein n=3 Tax=Plasmodium falciparum TaxID=5833 RepID=W4IRS7_PLAFP|nr:hypothetical protein PFMALIP_00539 [Plasmodium falciparum MaliPS096_E11]ETW52152.1 hypothetical protein PFUGPA_05767 [Plasmodium falciparum Palo Alto/Uganda]